jgi:hypothetical protein
VIRASVAVCVVWTSLTWSAPAFAVSGNCSTQTDLQDTQTECHRDAEQVRSLYGHAADDGYTYDLDPRCKAGDQRVNCQVFAGCTTADGDEGEIYIIWRYEDDTGVRTRVGTACLTPSEFRSLGAITPAMVRREMQRLTWPRAELEIQPPDGQTLINFQTVVLLGQQVTIEATPSEYTWHFGDGATKATTTPGAAYPDLDVTHDYADPGRISPSVDTTYTGRYRVNGDAWQEIPGTLTVEGEPVALRVRSAEPHLVGGPA